MKTKIMLILGIMFFISLTTRAQNIAWDLDQAMSQMSQQERQAVIMDFWNKSIQAFVTGNQEGIMALQMISPVIRKYDALFQLHDAAAAQAVNIIRNSYCGYSNPFNSMGASGMTEQVFECLERERGARHEQFQQQNQEYWRRRTKERLMNSGGYK